MFCCVNCCQINFVVCSLTLNCSTLNARAPFSLSGHAGNSRFSRAVRVSMPWRCHVWLWLSKFNGVVMSCFTLSRLAIFTGS